MSIFRSTFKPFVARQIAARQHLLKDGNGTDSGKRSLNVQYYTEAKSAWSRLVSFTDYYGSDALAKKYILEGGTLNTTADYKSAQLRYGLFGKNGAYGGNLGNNQYGYRPMPGITQVTVSHKGEYGSIRTATVKFHVSDKAQLDDVEVLYMRPGFSVLLEWGWTMYMDTSSPIDPDPNVSNLTTVVPTESELDRFVSAPMVPFNSPTINPFGDKYDYYTLNESIKRLQHKFSGNYDAMVGIVQNYSFELLPNGGYDCTITVVSPGDVLDSIKMNRPDNRSDETTGQTNSETKPYNTGFSRTLDNLIQCNTYDEFLKKEQIGVANLKGMVSERVILYLKSAGPGTSTASDAKSANATYIPLCLLIDIINQKHNLFTNKDTPYLDIEVPVYGDNPTQIGNGLCLASEDSVSIDPNVCIINNPKAKFVTGTDYGYSIKGQPNVKFLIDGEPDGNNLGVIGHIFVSVQKLKELYNNMIENNKGEVYIYSYLKEVLKEVQYALGGINSFNIFVNENKVVIIDENYTEPSSDTISAKKFKLNLIGNNTTVRSYKIMSKIFESQSNQMAIAAQNRENLGGIATATQTEMSKGLTDRLSRVKLTSDIKSSGKDDKATIIDEKKALAQGVLELRKYLSAFLKDSQFPATIASKPSAYTSLKSALLELNNDTNYRAVMPINFEATLDGVSGLSVGQIFTVEASALPKEYQHKRIGIIVTKSTDNIVKDWTKTIEGKIILLDQGAKRGELTYKDYQDIKNSVLKGAISELINEKIKKGTQELVTYRNLLGFIKAYYEGNVLLKGTATQKPSGYNDWSYTASATNVIVNTTGDTLIPEGSKQAYIKVFDAGITYYGQEIELSQNFSSILNTLNAKDIYYTLGPLGYSESPENRPFRAPAVKCTPDKAGLLKAMLTVIPDYNKLPEALKKHLINVAEVTGRRGTLSLDDAAFKAKSKADGVTRGIDQATIIPKQADFSEFGDVTYSPDGKSTFFIKPID